MLGRLTSRLFLVLVVFATAHAAEDDHDGDWEKVVPLEDNKEKEASERGMKYERAKIFEIAVLGMYVANEVEFQFKSI